jgi:predicted ATPase/DNA-binding XRE family transcriptional regulator/Tfp pilus assembly protein PilF
MLEPISFGTWLRQKRRALDLTQKAFADRVGCAEITVRRMEADEYKPSKELALTLFEKLGIPEPERSHWIPFARGNSSLPAPAIAPANKPKTNLPASLSSFIGREKEQADAIRLMNKHRLVTLTGSGGVGKTRFAIKIAEQLLENYPDGVWLIELASLNDSSLLPQIAATLFGLRTQVGFSHTDLLINFLRAKSSLLIWDNCEHLLDPSARLVEILLKNCPHLKILVTSREPLEITGEALYRLPSLRLPDLPYRMDSLRDVESVELFEERAQLIQFDFSLTAENASSVVQICRHLGGIPLAIELAAAKVGVLSPEQIATQLGESLSVLTGGSRIALPRHQTLRASMNWSWSLLTDVEQRLMRQLAVFAGGWTLEAAGSICDGDVLDLIHSLVAKSLIVINQRMENNIRYSFHETIRQYAGEKLVESGESEVMRGRHLDFFLAMALRFEREVHSPQISNWMRNLDVEYDNLREAMNWAAECGQAPSGLRLGYALHYFWLSRGYWSVGRESLEKLLACPEAAGHTIVRADALNLAADLATQQGDLQAARTLLEESRSIGLELGEAGKLSLGWSTMLVGQSWLGYDTAMAKYELDQSIRLLRDASETWRYAIAVMIRGNLAESQGDLGQARQLFEESRAILRHIGDTWTTVLPTHSLGRIFYDIGEYETASAYFHEALESYRGVDDKIYTPGTLADLGSVALLKGDDAQAITYFNESVARTRELMNKADIANILSRLGIALGHGGDHARATVLLQEGLELSHAIGNTYLMAACFTGLAGIQQQPGRAIRMLAAAQVAFERRGGLIDPLYRMEQARAENRLRERLAPQDFAKFYAEGRAMTFEQAVTLALEKEEGL